MKKLLLSLFVFPLLGMEINKDILRTSPALSRAKVIYDQKRFFVDNGYKEEVQRSNMNKELRSLSDDQIKRIFKNKEVLLYLRRLSNEKYALELQGKLNGGTGPFTAFVVGTVVKGACWAGVMLTTSLVFKGSEKAAGGDRAMATATTGVGMAAMSGAGGWAALATGIENVGNAAMAATLAIPVPLP